MGGGSDTIGLFHPFYQDKDVNIVGVGPEHSFYKESGRGEYRYATDQEALDGFLELSKIEGIIPALESSHAIAEGCKIAKNLDKDKIVLINLSGRGDKDVHQLKDCWIYKV